ncbi:MAG: response regulator transcription factor [Paludibacter sp.]|nr:response regulator transcription factor [Paludibacter sp.]
MDRKIKIALADDEMLIREGIKNILRQEDNFEIVFDVSNGNELIKQLEKSTHNLPDIILMDINMPECNGIEATKSIRAQFPKIHVVALSSYTSETFMKKMLYVGAVCYIPKSATPSQMIYRLNKVIENGFYYEDYMLSFIKSTTTENSAVANSEITERELEILNLICQQKSSPEIATLLHISPRTVDNHRNSLLQKTHSKSIVGLVVYAMQHNIFFPNNFEG